jgi:GNAT superfamily N-acetyltransferase
MDEVIGHLQAVPRADETHETDASTWEVTNAAEVEAHRGPGVGRALLEHAVSEARAAGVRRIVWRVHVKPSLTSIRVGVTSRHERWSDTGATSARDH